jgi:hypothetical protein
MNELLTKVQQSSRNIDVNNMNEMKVKQKIKKKEEKHTPESRQNEEKSY